MIEIITSITKTQVSKLSKNYSQIENMIIEQKDFSDKSHKIIKEYENIKIDQSELNKFNEISKSFLSVLMNDCDNLSPALDIQPYLIRQRNFNENYMMYMYLNNSDHLHLEEAQDSGHSYHLLTIKNNTSYYWENVTVYIPAINRKLVEGINLQPYETIKKTEEDEIDYDFELLQHQGVYVMKLMFYSHIISNDCYITRIILSELLPNGKVHELHTKNMGVAISNCAIIYTSKFTGNSQKIA